MKIIIMLVIGIEMAFFTYNYLGYRDALVEKGKVLSKSIKIADTSSTDTLTPALSNTPTLTPTISPTPTPKPPLTPTERPAVQPKFTSAEINGFIDRFAGQYGVDPNVLRHMALCESGFNPFAVSRNGLYKGLYQFSKNAWVSSRLKIGEDANPDLRLNAEEAIQTAAYAMSAGKIGLWPNCAP